MIPLTAQRSSIYGEFTEKERKQYFDLKKAKVLHHIDNLYYNVFVAGDNGNELPEGMDAMLSELYEAKYIKKQAYENDVELWGLDVFPSNYATYEYRLSCKEQYDIFISSYLPNDKTPRIHVQIRSRLLVLRGEENAIFDTFAKVQEILDMFGLRISLVQENRIDYAYHTNAVQNCNAYFRHEMLEEHLKTVFRKGQTVFYIKDKIEISYFALGFRTSNNLFFRCYDKSREVCEKAYKGFFLDRWRQNGLISNYDYFCYMEAYEKASYTVGLLVGRIKWYLKYGKNEELKAQLACKLKSCYTQACNSDALAKEIKGVLPEVTRICNFEFETKRKFYASFEDSLDNVIIKDYDGPQLLYKLFNLLANRETIHDYLTSRVVCFLEDRNDGKSSMQDFWHRIHTCKVGSIPAGDLKRDYSSTPDLRRAEKEFFASTAKLALITSSEENGDFEEDMSQVLSNLNDNHFYGFRSSPTGEDIRLNPAGYREVRQKKSYQARHLLNDLRKQAEEQRAIEQANAEAFKKFKARETAREENNNVKK